MVLILKSVRNQAHPRGELLSTICVVIAEIFLSFFLVIIAWDFLLFLERKKVDFFISIF